MPRGAGRRHDRTSDRSATCGSRLIWRPVDAAHPEYTNLSVGCLDAPEHAVPRDRLNDDLPRLRGDALPDLLAVWKAER